MNNLYYVVYQKDSKVVQVYNNKQELIDDFAPTYDVLCERFCFSQNIPVASKKL